jgi:hypothetical protein
MIASSETKRKPSALSIGTRARVSSAVRFPRDERRAVRRTVVQKDDTATRGVRLYPIADRHSCGVGAVSPRGPIGAVDIPTNRAHMSGGQGGVAIQGRGDGLVPRPVWGAKGDWSVARVEESGGLRHVGDDVGAAFALLREAGGNVRPGVDDSWRSRTMLDETQCCTSKLISDRRLA